MQSDVPNNRKQGFSETYWNLHRNSLVFSLAWVAASLPGVCLSQTQTWALVSGHFWQPLLQFALACAACYSFVAFFLEWRHEALSQFRLEAGRSADLPEQIERLIVEIGGEIRAADRARQGFAKALGNIDETLKNYAAINVSEGDTLQPLIQQTYREIIANISKGLPKVVDYQRSNPLPVPDMLNHAEIGPAVQHQLTSLATRIAQAAKFENASFAPDLQGALARMSDVVTQEEKITSELRTFQRRWADLRQALLRQNALATLRTWAVGIGAPTLLLLTAFSHGVSAWGVHILPVPPLSHLLGQPEACPTQLAVSSDAI
ncbi:MAG: hypothetical protein Q7J32_00855 [Sphingomonadaceae bacterium]|nr:hypothetical protein [Sphingomonadaceae bacterium]